MSFKEKAIFYYLVAKMHVHNTYARVKRCITDTNRVIAVGTDGEQKSVLLRYYAVRFLIYIINILSMIKSRLDIKVDKIQIEKDYESGEKTVIVDSNIHNKEVTLSSTINFLQNDSRDNIMGNVIFLKFEIVDPQNGNICLKDYIIKYRDHNKVYANTLNNIIVFNKINIVEDDSQLNIVFFKNGQRKTFIAPYKECYTKHISDFYDLA